MHPNDNLYLLALLFAVPFSSAAPIFSGSNDIDENGNFLPKGTGSVHTSEPLDRRDVFGDLIGTVENTVGGLAEGVLGPAMGKRDQPSYGTLQRRDVVGELNGVIDSANQAFGTIAGDVSQGLNPPDIPHIPSSKRSVGDLGPNSVSCMAVGGICDPQPVCAGGPGFCPGPNDLDSDTVFAKRDQKRGLAGDLPSKRSFGDLAPTNAVTKRGLVGGLPPLKRSLPLEDVTCAGKDCYTDPDSIPFSVLNDLPLPDAPVDDGTAQDGTTAKRDTEGSLPPRQLSSGSILGKRDGTLQPSERSLPEGVFHLPFICAGINCPGMDPIGTDNSNTFVQPPSDVPADDGTVQDGATAKRDTLVGSLPPRQLSSGSIFGKRDDTVVGELNGLPR